MTARLAGKLRSDRTSLARLHAWIVGPLGLLVACGSDDEPKPDPEPDGSGAEPGLVFGDGGESSSGGAGAASPSGGAAGHPDSGAPGGTSGSGTGGSGSFFIECQGAADCEPFGGGKVCCDTGTEGFCTKPSACPGETRP